VRLAFDYGHDKHFEGYGKVVHIFPSGSPVVRPDGWSRDIALAASDIIREP
jgi:hypothetical protein